MVTWMQDRKFTFESCGDTNWVFRFLVLPCFLDKELCFLWLWQGSPAKTTSGSQNSRGGLPRLSWGCLQAVSRLVPGCFHAVSMLSPGCLQVVSSFLTVSEFQIGSNRFLLLPICLPECHFLWFCASQTCNSFDLWRNNGCDVLQKFLAEETCLLLVPQRVVAVHYCVITAVLSRLQLPMRGAFQPQHIARSLSRNLEDPGSFFGIFDSI